MASRSTTTSKPKPKERKRISAASAHEKEFAEKIIGPKILAIIEAKNRQIGLLALTEAYNKAHGSTFSTTTLKKYLDILGWKYERVPTWTGLPPTAEESDSPAPAEPPVELTDETKPDNPRFGQPTGGQPVTTPEQSVQPGVGVVGAGSP